MEWLNSVVGLSSLILLEIILGIDNVVFLGILAHRLPIRERRRVVRWGLTLAWVARLAMLASALWLVRLTKPFFIFNTYSFSIHDLFFIVGGGFLIAKATQEIHGEVLKEHDDGLDLKEYKCTDKKTLYWKVIFQIALMDVIFSFDSVLTAVGLTTHYWVMSVAITVAIIVMLFASHKVNEMIVRYPTLKMLALSFLMLIGMVLIADGFALHIPRGYVYFAMVFSLAVESLNLFKRSRRSKI